MRGTSDNFATWYKRHSREKITGLCLNWSDKNFQMHVALWRRTCSWWRYQQIWNYRKYGIIAKLVKNFPILGVSSLSQNKDFEFCYFSLSRNKSFEFLYFTLLRNSDWGFRFFCSCELFIFYIIAKFGLRFSFFFCSYDLKSKTFHAWYRYGTGFVPQW